MPGFTTFFHTINKLWTVSVHSIKSVWQTDNKHHHATCLSHPVPVPCPECVVPIPDVSPPFTSHESQVASHLYSQASFRNPTASYSCAVLYCSFQAVQVRI